MYSLLRIVNGCITSMSEKERDLILSFPIDIVLIWLYSS